MSNWRPEGWRNPYQEIKDTHVMADMVGCKDDPEIFEAGADAMLEALKKRGIDHRVYADHLRFGIDRGAALLSGNEGSIIYQGVKGTLVFIPDEKEAHPA